MGPGRNRIAIAAASFFSLLASPVLAEDLDVCRTIRNEKARASCIEVGQVADSEKVRSGLTSVRSAVSPLTRERVATVTGRDLAASPDRFVGREVATRAAGCRYLDVNRYACRLPGAPSVRIDAAVVMPVTAQVAIETGCGTGRSAATPDCAASIQFTPNGARKGEDGTLVVTTPTIWVRQIAREGRRGPRRHRDQARSARP